MPKAKETQVENLGEIEECTSEVDFSQEPRESVEPKAEKKARKAFLPKRWIKPKKPQVSFLAQNLAKK